MSEIFHWENCNQCHVRFAFPQSLYQQACDFRPKVSIHCPNGHSFHYLGESDADRERRLRQAAEQRIAREIEEKRALEQEKKTLQHKHQLELKRINRRAKAGVCPCCSRTFSNMAQHMATKHPKFGKAA